MAAYVNQYGRKPGRGLRPWLLIPKVLGVAMYFGGTVAALVLSLATRPGATGGAAEPAVWMPWVLNMRTILVFAAVPGLLLAALCGVGLLVLHGKIITRMWWLRLKLAMLAVGVPVLHVLASTQLANVRGVIAGRDSDELAAMYAQCFEWVLLGAALLGAAVILVGRHKPRLGQPTLTVVQHKQVKESRV